MNDAGKQKSENKPDHKDNPGEPEKPNGRKGISRVSLVLSCGAIFSFLAAWGGLFGNLGHTFWIFAASLMMLASVFLGLGLRWELRNHHWLKWHYNSVASLVIGIGVLLGSSVILKELGRKEPMPHFKFSISTTTPPQVDFVPLTNDFLCVANFDGSPINGRLVVPLPTGQSNFTFRAVAHNDSLLVARDIMIVVAVPKKWDSLADSSFIEFENQDDKTVFEQFGVMKTNAVKSYGFNVPNSVSLLPGNWIPLPPIAISGNLFEPGVVTIAARAQGSPTCGVVFWTHFIPTPTNAPPWWPAKPFVEIITKPN